MLQPIMSIIAITLLLLASLYVPTATGQIGVCWGRNSWQPIPPRIIVKLLEDNGISKIKLFSADNDILRALVGHNIEVAVMLGNDYLSQVASSQTEATKWVSNNVQPFIFPGGANITMISVGNEPFLSSFNGQYDNLVVPALENIQEALIELNLDSTVKVTVPLNSDILESSFPPSSGRLRSEIAPQVSQIAGILSNAGSVFTINIYPYLTLYQDQSDAITSSMAMLDANANRIWGQLGSPGGWDYVDPMTKLKYGNIFDGAYDAVLAALTRVGYPTLTVEVGEVGWPSEGDNSTRGYATLENAEIFNNAIIAHMLSGKGTPARPNVPINGYLFSLTDEDRKATGAGAFERHWGIFRSDGIPKYSLDFSGGGGQASGAQIAADTVTGVGASTGNLTEAQGIPFLPKQWCISKRGTTAAQLSRAISYACGDDFASDCTPTLPGGLCYFDGNITKLVNYAFNSFYQLNNQSALTCQFSGLGQVVTEDPSEDGCIFQIGINENGKGALRRTSSLLLPVFLVAYAVLTLVLY